MVRKEERRGIVERALQLDELPLDVLQASNALVGKLTESGWGEIKTEEEEDEYEKNVGTLICSLIALASTATI